MADVVVVATESPAEVLTTVGDLLVRDPVRHNLILTLLRARAGHPGAGLGYRAVAEALRYRFDPVNRPGAPATAR
jgi:hypothetical protein